MAVSPDRAIRSKLRAARRSAFGNLQESRRVGRIAVKSRFARRANSVAIRSRAIMIELSAFA
jgi:hypothetical protein